MEPKKSDIRINFPRKRNTFHSAHPSHSYPYYMLQVAPHPNINCFHLTQLIIFSSLTFSYHNKSSKSDFKKYICTRMYLIHTRFALVEKLASQKNVSSVPRISFRFWTANRRYVEETINSKLLDKKM